LQRVAPPDKLTKLYLALRNAIDIRQRTDAGLPSRRVIVILSDGKDEGSGFTADDVGRIFQQSPIPIYAIGFSRLPSSQRNTYLEALNRVAVLSGGLYVEGSSLPAAYEAVREAIQRVFLIRLECQACQVSNQSQPLEMTYKKGTTSRTDRLAVTLSLAPQAPEKPPTKGSRSRNLVLSAIAVLVAAIAGMVIITRKKPEADTPPPPPDEPKGYVEVVSPSAAGRNLEMTVLSGNARGRVDKVALSSKIVVGRDKMCDVSYPDDAEMSAKHFELIQVREHVEVQDLGSSNGTLLNGAQLVTQQRIEDGDWIRAGLTELRINFGGQ
jgi:hypothetical protein